MLGKIVVLKPSGQKFDYHFKINLIHQWFQLSSMVAGFPGGV